MDSKLFEHLIKAKREEKRRLFWWRAAVVWTLIAIFMAGVAVGRMSV